VKKALVIYSNGRRVEVVDWGFTPGVWSGTGDSPFTYEATETPGVLFKTKWGKGSGEALWTKEVRGWIEEVAA
jgi:hypothetical protein